MENHYFCEKCNLHTYDDGSHRFFGEYKYFSTREIKHEFFMNCLLCDKMCRCLGESLNYLGKHYYCDDCKLHNYSRGFYRFFCSKLGFLSKKHFLSYMKLRVFS